NLLAQQPCLKQLKDVPPPASMDINKEACKRYVVSKMACYICVGKDRKEGACYTCNTKKVSCNLVLKGKGKVQDLAGAPGNKGICKGKGKVILPPYIANMDKEYEEDEEEEGEDEEEVVEVLPPHSIIPMDPHLAPHWPSAPGVQSTSDQQQPAPRRLAPRNSAPGPSTDPLLHAALSPTQHHVPLPSPPPFGGVQPNQGWYQQMVDYVAEHVLGDGFHDNVNQRIVNLEQSTQEGFARIGVRLKAIQGRADTTTHRINNLERRLMELEAILSAPPMVPSPPAPIIFVSPDLSPAPCSEDEAGTNKSLAKVSMTKEEVSDAKHDDHPTRPMTGTDGQVQDDEDETRASDTKVKVSDAEVDAPGASRAPQLATPGLVPIADVGTVVMESEMVAEGIQVEHRMAETIPDSAVAAGSVVAGGASGEKVVETSIAVATAAAAATSPSGTDIVGPPPSIACPLIMLISKAQHCQASQDRM
ncbi:hypothetical protein DXG01_006650, partial [Tephrocybe rancida]